MQRQVVLCLCLFVGRGLGATGEMAALKRLLLTLGDSYNKGDPFKVSGPMVRDKVGKSNTLPPTIPSGMLQEEPTPSSDWSNAATAPSSLLSNAATAPSSDWSNANTVPTDREPYGDGYKINGGTFKVEKHEYVERHHNPVSEQWFGQTGRDFHGWRDELNFPGSGYVLDMIDAYLTNGLYLEATISDPFRANISNIESIASDLDDVTSVIADPDVLALIYTRRMTSYIQQERMLCAAAKFDMISMKAMMMEINSLFADDDDSMEDFLLTLLTDLPSVPGQQWTTQTLAAELSLRVHDRIFNDTVHYLLGRSYRDVTMFSRGLYTSLTRFFRSQYVGADTFVAIVTDILYYDSNVHCPTDPELKMYRRDAMWDLTSSLEEIETTELCMGMRSFIESNFLTSGASIGKLSTYDQYDKKMEEICDYVKTYVTHLYTNVKEYERMLMQRDPDGLKNLFQKYLSTNGLLTLVSVLETLRWVPTFPIVDNVRPAKLNTTLPADHVIEQVQNDISFWQSFLDNLTPERFAQMDLTHFKQSIKHWLDQKHELVKGYNSNSHH